MFQGLVFIIHFYQENLSQKGDFNNDNKITAESTKYTRVILKIIMCNLKIMFH